MSWEEMRKRMFTYMLTPLSYKTVDVLDTFFAIRVCFYITLIRPKDKIRRIAAVLRPIDDTRDYAECQQSPILVVVLNTYRHDHLDPNRTQKTSTFSSPTATASRSRYCYPKA